MRTATAVAAYESHASSRSSSGSAGQTSGTYSPPSLGESAEQRLGKAELRAPARGWRRTSRSAPTTRSSASTLRTDGELAQVVDGRLHGGLLGVVGDEEQPGVRPEALLLGRSDADAVSGQHTR